jgi:NosR/NirI family transcriptional regulator, nitrous oxide reductase regulator
MPNVFLRYARWLHTRWPAGTVEPLPESRADGTTALEGVRIVGDLTGIPLLKFSSDTGARAAAAVADELAAEPPSDPDVLDLAIVGGGVSGIAAALEARRRGLAFAVFEASEPFATVANFPAGKPIYTYPTAMTPAGQMQFRKEVHPKEELLASLEGQRRAAGIEPTPARIDRIERRDGVLLLHEEGAPPIRARRVIVAIGRSGDFRRLDIQGEDSGKVFNRLFDPKDYAGRRALVVGGGDSALEAAVALACAGARVTLSYRGAHFVRPKPGNVEALRRLERATGAAPAPEPGGTVHLAFSTDVVRIEPDRVFLREASGAELPLDNDVVFTMLGREAPLDFFRRSKIPVRGEWRAGTAAAFALFLAFCFFLYNWKGGGALTGIFEARKLFPFNVPALLARAGGSLARASARPAHLLGTLAISLSEPGFYYSTAYCLAVLLFGIARIRRRRTPYVTAQTLALIAIQLVPLFLLPYVLLPWWGHNGGFDSGWAKIAADHLFPAAGSGQGREYWRAFGFILAWPLFVWNVFSPRPMSWWLAIAFLQTFVAIPLIVRRWGKGAYCGWICSCGALAETLGDSHRQKMPHGPLWNRLNMTGQAVLAAAFALFAGRVISWSFPATRIGTAAGKFYDGMLSGWRLGPIPLNYARLVDMFLAGIVGVGFYFWFSGRVWCRFACPLAALMHVYARFSRFRIFAEKSKCISCNVCTSVCHQGIDVMSFANKGLPMEDPQCVRCSACVQMCPTGVLSFGRVGAGGLPVLDRLPASPVRMQEPAQGLPP